MMHLKELDMSSMPELVSIDSFALDNLPELTKMEVTNNTRLSFTHPRSFHRQPSLETRMLNDDVARQHCGIAAHPAGGQSEQQSHLL